jgi:hypothetical protein
MCVLLERVVDNEVRSRCIVQQSLSEDHYNGKKEYPASNL